MAAMAIGDWDEGTLARFIEDALERAPVIAALLSVESQHIVGAANQPPFENTWVNNDAGVFPAGRSARFYRRGERVHLAGVIRSGTLGASAFTLPVGFRPATEVVFAVNANEVFGTVRVQPGGGVIIGPNASATYTFLDGISFRVV